MPYVFIYKAVRSSSSKITRRTHRFEMKRYAFDQVLYQPGKICRTCQFLKPARSKHCNICNMCIAKHDHHCVWLMNCLGKGNYIYFLGLLASLGIMLNYGTFIAHNILLHTLQSDFQKYSHSDQKGRKWSVDLTWGSYFDAWTRTISQNYRIGSVGLLTLFIGPLAWVLFVYHTYLIWAGMTTNESAKWADWRDDIVAGVVVKKEKPIPQINNNIERPDLEESLYFFDRPGDDAFSDAWIKDRWASGWKKVESLDEMHNLYDLGFTNNLRDVLDTG